MQPPLTLVPDDDVPPPEPAGLASRIFSPWLIMLVSFIVAVANSYPAAVEELARGFQPADLATFGFLAGIALRRWRRGVLNTFMTGPILMLGLAFMLLVSMVSSGIGFVHALDPTLRLPVPALGEPAPRSLISYFIATNPWVKAIYAKKHPGGRIPQWPDPVPPPLAQALQGEPRPSQPQAQGRAPAGRAQVSRPPQGAPSRPPPPVAAEPPPRARPEREMHALPGLVVVVPGWAAAEEDTRADLGRLRLYDPTAPSRYIEVFWAKSDPMSPVELAEMWTGAGSRVITNAVVKVSGHDATRLELAMPDGSGRRFVTGWNCPEHERRLYVLCDLDRPREELLRLHEEIAASVRCHLPIEGR